MNQMARILPEGALGSAWSVGHQAQRSWTQWLQDSLRSVDMAPRALPPAAPSDREPSSPVQALDRLVPAMLARSTKGISPVSLGLAGMDWAMHSAMVPGHQARLVEKAARKALRLWTYAARASFDDHAPKPVEPLPGDHRFDDPAWNLWPWNVMHQSFLLGQQWWHAATTGIAGVSKQHEDTVNFFARQMLDVASPSNNPMINPEILRRTLEEGGANLRRGWTNLLEDTERQMLGRPPVGTEDFIIGRDLAATPGRVVYRNHLIELIQYSPTTPEVQAEPVLIVPAWIMKYYILDLSPENSMIRYLVDQGHTVFAISWRNPEAEDRNLTLDDYRRMGIEDAIKAVSTILPDERIHACGYCLGGTLLSIEAATMAREGNDRLASVTLLAAQTDFTEAGELMLFIDDAQVAFLEALMWDQGTLDTAQMAGAFQMLRSNDLIWSANIRRYWLGERDDLIDLMAWNSDATRMPYRMHSEYLRKMFLENQLATGNYLVDDKPVALTDIRAPIFAVGTEKDHIAPWQSVYKILLLSDTEVSFCLVKGGHNAGIVSEPGHPRRHYRLRHHDVERRHIDPERWVATTEKRDGSWWPAWSQWMIEHGAGKTVKPPRMGAPEAGLPPLEAAPGTYIHQH